MSAAAMENDEREVVYTPDSDLRHPMELLARMHGDLLASRELAWRLFVRNTSAQYRQSLLGYAWAFLPPLITTAIWVFLNEQGVLKVGSTGMPYTLFVLSGTVFWQTFLESVNTPLKIVNESRSMLAKVNFPREALVLAGIGQVLFSFLIRFVVLIPFLLWFGVSFHIGALLTPVGVAGLVLFGTMIGLLLTPLGVLFLDIDRSLTIALQALFFLTPVVFPVPQVSAAAVLVRANPLTPLLETCRSLLINGSANGLDGLLVVVGMTLVLLVSGWVLFRLSMPHLIARMSS